MMSEIYSKVVLGEKKVQIHIIYNTYTNKYTREYDNANVVKYNKLLLWLKI